MFFLRTNHWNVETWFHLVISRTRVVYVRPLGGGGGNLQLDTFCVCLQTFSVRPLSDRVASTTPNKILKVKNVKGSPKGIEITWFLIRLT